MNLPDSSAPLPTGLKTAALVLALALVGGCGFLGAGDPESARPSVAMTTRNVTATPSPTPTPETASASPPTTTPTAIEDNQPRIGPRFFGVHDPSPFGGSTGWPRAPVGSYRAWDAGVSWREIETRPGVFQFARLDAIVHTARSHNADVLLVLGQTPQFYASHPSQPSAYGPGASSMPDLSAWKRYVEVMATRYARKGVTLQVWNEANVINYWTGTTAQMAQLTRTAHQVLARISPRSRLVAPALAVRLNGQRNWLNRFYAERVGGRPVGDWVDVVSLQLYPLASGSPEDSIALLTTIRAELARRGLRKPIWNTEINYGLTGGGRDVPSLSGELQGAQVARTYLLNAAEGVERVFWYSWVYLSFANTNMVAPDGSTTTAAGRVFRTVRSWMQGTRVQSCEKNAVGTYECVLIHPREIRRIYWNPTRTVEDALTGARLDRLDGSHRTLSKGWVPLRIGASPVLIRSEPVLPSPSPSSSPVSGT